MIDITITIEEYITYNDAKYTLGIMGYVIMKLDEIAEEKIQNESAVDIGLISTVH